MNIRNHASVREFIRQTTAAGVFRLTSFVISGFLMVTFAGCNGGTEPQAMPIPAVSPVANAGSDQNVTTGSLATLDGSGSSDANGDALSYSWRLSNQPAGSAAFLSNAASIAPSFTTDVDGTYVVGLVVNDGNSNSAEDFVDIVSTSGNNAPVASAGPDQVVSTGQLLMLDGSASSDADGDSLAYTWSVATRPSGSVAAVVNPTVVNPNFTSDLDGTYVVQLVVNDGTVSSAPDTVSIVSTTQTVTVSDNFDGDGALLNYTTNNPSDLPDVTRSTDRYRANLADNTGNVTLHLNNSQGRLDAKLVTFPFEYIARNIGIGTQADSQQAPPFASTPTTLAGVQVHVTTLSERNSAHIVVGHSTNIGFTVEGKNTVNAVSVFDTAGANVVPLGRADLRVIGNADRTLTVFWQTPNPAPGSQADNWTLYNGSLGFGAGNLPGSAPTFGTSVYVGLITYAAGSDGVPFVGTCDSVELVGE